MHTRSNSTRTFGSNTKSRVSGNFPPVSSSVLKNNDISFYITLNYVKHNPLIGQSPKIMQEKERKKNRNPAVTLAEVFFLPLIPG